MMNEEQNNTVLTEIKTEENYVSPEVEENTEKFSTEKIDIVVEENVEENTDSENNSAPEDLSSASSETDNLTEKEKLETEVENTILPNIYNGVISEDYVEKLMRLGDLYAENSRNKESAIYLQYYYYMIARYVFEQIYNDTQEEKHLYTIFMFEHRYNPIKLQYQRLRNNSLPNELKLVKEFVESCEKTIHISKKENFIDIILTDDATNKDNVGYNLYFFPESDYYGKIDSIRLELLAPSRIDFSLKNAGKTINSLEITYNDFKFLYCHGKKKNKIVSGSMGGLKVYINNKEFQYIQKNSTYSKPINEFDDLFRSWENFIQCLNVESVEFEYKWVLIYILYLTIRHNDENITIYKIKELYRTSNRAVDWRVKYLATRLKECAERQFVNYAFPYVSLTKIGKELIIKRYLNISENEFNSAIEYHKKCLSKKHIKVCNHPTYKTWEQFQELVNTDLRITVRKWYLLYLYYIMQRFSVTSVTNDEMKVIFIEDQRFKSTTTGIVSLKFQGYINIGLICASDKKYSFTIKGKGYIRKLLKKSFLNRNDKKNYILADSVNNSLQSNDQENYDTQNQPTSIDIFESWNIFKKYLFINKITGYARWFLVFLFYLEHYYNHNKFSLFRIQLLYKESRLLKGDDKSFICSSIRYCVDLGYVQYDNITISLNEKGKTYVVDNYLKISKEDLEKYDNYRKTIIENTCFKISNHPICSTWNKFKSLICNTNNITLPAWHLLYAYYIMQYYNTEVISNNDVAGLFRDDGRFSGRKTGSAPQNLRSCVAHRWIEPNEYVFSLTEKGKEYIRSLICTEDQS